jgi:hypothetical protein
MAFASPLQPVGVPVTKVIFTTMLLVEVELVVEMLELVAAARLLKTPLFNVLSLKGLPEVVTASVDPAVAVPAHLLGAYGAHLASLPVVIHGGGGPGGSCE